MGSTSLYIIGNGFDIYHGINSRYSDFKEYLSKTDYSLRKLVEEFLLVEENWSDLEQALARLDIEVVWDIASGFLKSYAAEDWSDSYHHDYQYEINRITESLSSGLKARFTDWVLQLHIPSRNKVASKLLNLDLDGRYLTFNYTPTLGKVYEIPETNTLFIHGNAMPEASELILGHAWNPVEIPSLNDVGDPESLDPRVMEGNDIMGLRPGEWVKIA